MSRILAIIGLTLATLGGAVAGTIVPINLTAAPVGVCTNMGSNCTVSSVTTGSFENQLFTTLLPPSPPTPGSNPQTVGPASFILAAQSGAVNTGDDEYLSTGTKGLDTSILVDLGTCTGTSPSSACGLQDVDDLYTMIQASGTYGFQGVTITLNGVAANGTTPITDVIDLTSGIDYRSVNSALAATCTDANSNNPTNNVSTACTVQNSDTASVSGTDSSPGGTGGNTVITYNNVLGAETSGATNYYLDVQELELGTNFLGGYLDSVTITNDSTSTTKNQIAFSGLAADEIDPAPEPGTVALLGIGLGLVAFRKIRGRRPNSSLALD